MHDSSVELMTMMAICIYFSLSLLLVLGDGEGVSNLGKDIHANYSFDVPCDANLSPDSSKYQDIGCLTSMCKRIIRDGMFTDDEVAALKAIAVKGMAKRVSLGGPTILDINSGHLRDTAGLINLFDERSNFSYTAEEFSTYGNIIRKLKSILETTFEIQNLMFTAPTFITRLEGKTGWQPNEVHDEYWHPHADRDNTQHYHYSGLLYLSTYGDDFLGGKLNFLSTDSIGKKSEKVLDVEPKAGRVVMFTSGKENYHHVERVTSGERFVLAFWFTCDARREMEIFLDGNAHIEFSNKIKRALISKRQMEEGRREL